jgi:DNA repair exonuclease SbcCD ATPase subunit
MINRLELRNWRAYEHLQLTLHRGTTFVVARNGIGKTSIIEAAAWALYGDAAGRPEGAIRLGADSASATVEMTLADGRRLTVTRDLPKRLAKGSTPPVSATLAGKKLPQTELDATIRNTLGGHPAVLARLTMLRGVAHLDQDTPGLNLPEHLCRFFGIDGLQDALAQLAGRDKDINRRIRTLRQGTAVTANQLARLRQQHQDAQAATVEAQDAHRRAVAATNMAAQDMAQAEAYQQWQQTERARQAALAALCDEIATAYATPVTSADLPTVLDRLESQTGARLDALRRSRARLEGRIEAVDAAIAELDAATNGHCPVCRRPLSADDATRAKADHLDELCAMRDELASLGEAAAEQALQTVRGHLRRLTELTPREQAPASPPVHLDRATAALAAAQAAAEAATQQMVTTQAAAMTAQTAINNAESQQRANDQLATAYRTLGLVNAARTAIQSTVDTMLAQTIDPLGRAVADRWKRLFNDRGPLIVTGQGVQSRDFNGDTLPFGSFSTGEKMAAQLLLRLIVVDAATHASFCWIDEPLEHLDPDTRRQLASMLAATPAISGVRQLLVTTYEEPLARRLAAHATGDVNLVYVRPGSQDPAG